MPLDSFHKTRFAFGGSLLGSRTNPKAKRPLNSKLPIHLVLRANRSWMRLPKHYADVTFTVERVAKRHGVRVYAFANVGNHLHLLIKIVRRPRWAAFIRELTGRLAMLTGGSKTWASRPFTRVVNGWRKAYRSVKQYVKLNAWEAEQCLDAEGSRVLRGLERIWRVKNPDFSWTDWDLDG